MNALDSVRRRRRAVVHAVARDRARLLERASSAAPELVEAARSPWAIVGGGLLGGALCGVWLARADGGRMRRTLGSTVRRAAGFARTLAVSVAARMLSPAGEAD